MDDFEAARIRAVYAEREDSGLSERYSLLQPDALYAAQDLERRMTERLGSMYGTKVSNLRVLDVGCGTGAWLRRFIQWGFRPQNLQGIDVLEDRIAEARALSPSEMEFTSGNLVSARLSPDSFDLALQCTVFSSVLDPHIRVALAREIVRLLKPGGRLFWYDLRMNNPSNPNVKRVGAEEIRRLFEGCAVHLHRCSLAPPLARFVAPRSYLVYQGLSRVPLLCTHYFAVICKPNEGGLP